MRERTIYECEHCSKKRYLSKYKTRDHEEICWHNPKNKACNTCKHNYFDTCKHNHFGGVQRTCELGIKTEIKPMVNCKKWEEIYEE